MTLRSRQSIILVVAASGVVAAGCYFGDYCPVTPGAPLGKIRLEGMWRLTLLGQDALPGAKSKTASAALMIEGETFLAFDFLGNMTYVGTLGRDQTVGLWEINMSTGLAARGLSGQSGGTGSISISEVRSTVTEMDDGTVTMRMGWRERTEGDATETDVAVVLEQMRFGATADQVTGLMSTIESPTGGTPPEQTHLVGEILLERIEPEIREFLGDIYPAGDITALGGPAPPYNEDVTFGASQWFTLDASQTTGPAGAELTYYWHVVRELTDPSSGEVIEGDPIFALPGESSSFVASSPGRYYVTLYVTDGVLWRSTQTLGQQSALTRYVKVE